MINGDWAHRWAHELSSAWHGTDLLFLLATPLLVGMAIGFAKGTRLFVVFSFLTSVALLAFVQVVLGWTFCNAN
jgi:hypothetical protein